MLQEHFNFVSGDGIKLFVYKWLPDNRDGVKAVVHIMHGMGEHSGRYEDFAGFLTGQGFAVYACDQRGHGKTAGSPERFGHYGDSGGWDLVLSDIRKLNDIITEQNPGKNIFIFGHSAGAFLASDIIMFNPEKISGAILCATMASPGTIGMLGILVAKYIIRKKGPKAKSPFHKKLTFEKFNNYFKPVRTTADWISRDENAVDAMIADPYCYTLFSATFYLDLVKAAYRVNDLKNIKKIPEDMHVLIISGTCCALGDFGKGTRKVYSDYLKAGPANVELRLYEGARHELLNEINRDEVYRDIKNWLLK